LSFTFHPVINEEYRREPPSKVTLELEAGAGGAVTRLTLVHDENFPKAAQSAVPAPQGGRRS
jgi:hypothetical protein